MNDEGYLLGISAVVGDADLELWWEDAGLALLLGSMLKSGVGCLPLRRRQSKKARQAMIMTSARPPTVPPITALVFVPEADDEDEGVAAALRVGCITVGEADVLDNVCVGLDEPSGIAEYGAASASSVESVAARRSSGGQPFCWQGLEVQQPMKVGLVF